MPVGALEPPGSKLLNPLLIVSKGLAVLKVGTDAVPGNDVVSIGGRLKPGSVGPIGGGVSF
jgi:hypothetical protein